MKTIKFLSIVAAAAVIFSSCSKGDTGTAGAAGPQGPAGTNGVANISSNIYSITPGSWSTISGGYGVNISDAAIANADADGIEVFISTTTGEYLGLPISSFFVNGDEMAYVYQNGSIALAYLYTSAPTQTVNLKVVVIPPSIMVQNPNTNWHDYNQVQNIINSQTSRQ